MSDRISIVTPVYNASSYIRETIDAVARQTYPDWEWILVDDASTDGSAGVIRQAAEELDPSLQKKIRLVELTENGGAAAARNRGVQEAQGRYLCYLDADDIWKPEKLERELAFLKEKNAAFVCHAYEFGDEDARPTGRIVHVLPEMTYKKALTRTVIFTSTVMIDLKKLDKSKIKMPACGSEDTALWWQILRGGTSCFGLDEVLCIYRRPPKSLSSNKGRAVKRIWYLYRQREHLSVPRAAWCLAGWAVRATLRRL